MQMDEVELFSGNVNKICLWLNFCAFYWIPYYSVHHGWKWIQIPKLLVVY